MTILAATSEFDGWDIIPSGPDNMLSMSANVASRTRGSIYISETAETAVLSFSPVSDMWFHTHIKPAPQNNYTDGGQWYLVLRDEDDTAIGGIWVDVTKPNDVLQFKVGTDEKVVNVATNVDVDIHVQVGNPGLFEVYISGVLEWTFTGNTQPGTSTKVASMLVNSVTHRDFNSYQFSFSEVIIADEPTLGFALYTIEPVADGATADFLGDVSNINNLIPAAQIDAMTAQAVGDAHLFDLATMPTLPQGGEIKAVTLAAKTLPVGSPTIVSFDAQVDTLAAGVPDTGAVTDGAAMLVMETNPATNQPWTVAEINAAQFGFKAL